jgi:hypothetical protein
MILHVTFTDGSNPWVSLPADRHTIAKLWRQWMKNHPTTAQPVAFMGEYAIYRHNPKATNGYKLEKRNYNDFDSYMHYDYIKTYKTLGHALLALEKLGGGGA